MAVLGCVGFLPRPGSPIRRSADPPILDWFHIAMRLQHLKQIARVLSANGREQAAAKSTIVAEVERLRWRLWNGKAKERMPGSAWIASAPSCIISRARRLGQGPACRRENFGPHCTR